MTRQSDRKNRQKPIGSPGKQGPPGERGSHYAPPRPTGHSKGALHVLEQPEPAQPQHRLKHPWEHREARERMLLQLASERFVERLERSRGGAFCARCGHLMARTVIHEWGLSYEPLRRDMDGGVRCFYCGHVRGIAVPVDQRVDGGDMDALMQARREPVELPPEKRCNIGGCGKVVAMGWKLREDRDGTWSWIDDRNHIRHTHPSAARVKKAGYASAAERLKRDKGARERYEAERK